MNTASKFPMLTKEDVKKLEKDVTDVEIKNPFFNLGATKAPGLDRYLALLYHANWQVVGKS